MREIGGSIPLKVLIWGTGYTAELFWAYRKNNWGFDVVAYIDNDCKKWDSEYRGKMIFSPKMVMKLDYEKIIICVQDYQSIYGQLTEEYHVEESKILTFDEACEAVEKYLGERLIDKYAESDDEDIKKVIGHYKKNGFSIYGYYDQIDMDYQVFYDADQFPYVLFEGKRMYFPKECSFAYKNGKYFAKNILGEQMSGSPHLYVRDQEEIKKDSVIIDAGVCEGNFALRYVEEAKRIYLIESDPVWMGALRKTFAAYSDKVVFCNKFLGRYDNENTITLDRLVDEKIDFLKMDIEGAEVDALLGARRVLEQSDARCAVCSYHKQNDERYIRYLLNNYGYETDTSEGYMFYIYDDDIFDSLDFRRGIVHAVKGERPISE